MRRVGGWVGRRVGGAVVEEEEEEEEALAWATEET